MIHIALAFFIALPAAAGAQDLVPYRSGAKWGYAAPGGNLKIRARYDTARPFSEGLALVMKKGRYGFIDDRGREKIKAVYQSAGPFSESLAPVKSRGRWGYIRTDGSEAHYFTLDEAGFFSGGRAPVTKDGETGLMSKGMKFIPCAYEEIQPFSEGLARVRRGGLYGFVDADCREATPAVYDETFPFSGGFASARLRGKYGFILRESMAFKAKDYIGIGPYSEG
ncbi:MAG: WG repeat-containing protein, partial [Elusimicrobiales bacterium]|nr:WG repeat-containing protein [Elusimicrobiales bacterium]